MSHEYIGCNDPDCQLCQAYRKGREDLCNVLLYVRDHGLPDGARVCNTSMRSPALHLAMDAGLRLSSGRGQGSH